MPPVHPVAALFPMLPDDELEDLARDIKQNGLIHPIVLDAEGTLIDGRNRLTACRLVGVEPRYTTLGEQDPVAYILGSNVNRRHLSAGQRAMAAAMAAKFFPEKFQGKGETARRIGVSNGRLSYAIIVQEHAPELADEVMAGILSLNDAYAEAKERKAAAEERRDEAEQAARQLAQLRKDAPDLADLVAEERMTLAEAIHIWRKRQQDEREARERMTAGFVNAASIVWAMVKDDPERVVNGWLPEANKFANIPELRPLWTAEGLRRLSESLGRMADAIEKQGGTL